MLELVLDWVVLLIALLVFAIGQTGKGGALTLAYFLGLSLIHVPGVVPFVVSRFDLEHGDVTRVGFEMTLLGMSAFVAGAVLARRVDSRRMAGPRHSPLMPAQTFERLGWRAFAIGGVAYFVFIPLSRSVPSLTAVTSGVATILILGLWLVLYGAAVAADKHRTVPTLVLLPLLPLATLVTGGFLGYGVYWVLSVVAFLFVIARQRMLFYLGAPLAVYLGLSFFVTYMGERTAIREVVWQEQTTLFDRLDRASTLVTHFQMLDLNSPVHVAAIDGRLNQNDLVGAAVESHETGWAHLAYGATVPVWALIPRAIWPDKPIVGGGRNVVSNFTGIQFAKGTSVGAGQVLEFYVNFGVPGLVIGFICLGFALMRLDIGIMRALAAGDTRGLVLRAMPGIALLQPGGNLLEIIVAAAAAFFGAHLVLWLRLLDTPLAAPGRRGTERRFLRDAGAKVRKVRN
jgi:hypothetical protein